MFDLTQTCELNLKADFQKEARVEAESPVVEVAVEDDFTSGPGNNSTTVTHSSTFEMNPNHSSGSTSSTSSSYVPGFYAGPGPGSFGPAGGYPGGPMSPYSTPPAPISPYANQNQGAPNGGGSGGGGGGTLYGNQNSPLYNQNQSSSYSGPGPGAYIHPGQTSLQSYYNNHSPTHQQFQYGGGQPPLRHPSPPPLGMMMGSRIPHPSINSPNQNVVPGGNQMKTESMDLKPGSTSGNMYSQPAPSSQGYSGPAYGYNGYPAPTRPLMSPMSPHGRLNISPGGPNLSPRETPGPNMSPHPSLYSGQQASPGPGHGQHHGQGYQQAQYSDYFNKMGASPGYGGPANIKEELPADQRVASFHNDDKLSDVQSNASVRSGEDTPKHSSFCDDSSNPTLTNLVSVKKETNNESQQADPTDKNSSGDSDNENKFTPKSESEDTKPEGSYFEEHKDFTLKANQILIDNMNIDSIPELPEIPELRYSDVSEMAGDQTRSSHNSQQSDKEAGGGHHKGMSPEVKDGLGRWEEQSEEEGYHENMGGWGHMQDGMDPGYQAHQMSYPNQQQMWANFYGSSGGPPGGDGGQGGQARYPPPLAQAGPPHCGLEPGWWQGHTPDMSGYRMPGPGIPPAPGPWALRGPRPRGERRGPGRPRLTNKGDPRGENRPRSAGLPGAQFPSPYPDGLPAEMMGDHKRGPGRPKALLDPNSPKVAGDTTKNGNKKRYTCEVCQKRFSTAWYVRVHRRSHNGERPYVCNNCGKGFMLPNVLQVHLRKCEKNNPPVGGGSGQPGQNSETDPPSQSPSQGGTGGPQGFPAGYPDGGQNLSSQQSAGYPGMAGYNQRYLGGLGSPTFNPGMSSELPPMSGGHGSYPGPEAGGQPGGQPGYLGQSVSPGLERPLYSPDTALPSLPISSDSEQHHFLANDKPRDKGGGDPSSLTEEHIKTDRPFSCEMCDKRFSQKCNLVTHMRLHTGEKPYICEFCDKRFTQKGNLDAHIKTHTKEKPFQCSLCPGKRFAFKSSLQAHIRGHQNGNTYPEADMEDDDLESLKENAKMQDIDKNRATDDEEDDMEDNDPEGSPSMSPPPLPKFGATIQQFNSKELNSSPETDISKLSDSRQTVAMLQ